MIEPVRGRGELTMNDQTKDQIASVMLQHGTPEQQKEALLYCGGDLVAARIEIGNASGYRLKRTVHGELILQGCFQWQQGNDGGFNWRDIETVVE